MNGEARVGDTWITTRRMVLSMGASSLVIGTVGCLGNDEGEAVRFRLSGPAEEVEVFTTADIETAGEIFHEQSRYGFLVELRETATEDVRIALEEAGARDDPRESRLEIYLNGELVLSAGLTPGILENWFDPNPDRELALTFEERETAQHVLDALAREIE